MGSRTFIQRAQFVQTGNPTTVNDVAPYAPGQVGSYLPDSDRLYQYVKTDSNAAPAAALVAFWKDKTNYIVTTVLADANGGVGDGRNFVAGIFMNSVTAGSYGYILKEGKGVNVKCASSPTAGDLLIANTGTNSDATSVAVGSAPTVNIKRIGVATAAKSGANVATDVEIGFDTV
jgi:hypothetical protein